MRRERNARGLSTRHRALLAGVSHPTISRIENGHEIPNWTTMRTIAAAFGKSCAFENTRDITRLSDLVEPLDGNIEAEPHWTRLRVFADQRALHPELTAVATADQPESSGSAFIDNLLAAIAEKAAVNVKIRPSSWTAEIKPLEIMWEAPDTKRMRAIVAANTPPEFAARNIMLSASAIWRDRGPAAS